MPTTPNLYRMPELTGDWGKDMPVVREFFARVLSDLVSTMNGNVGATNNLGFQFKTLTVKQSGPFPIPVPVNLKTVSWVDVATAQDSTTSALTSVALGPVAWGFDGGSTVTITAISGMTVGHTYNITLVFVP